MLMLNILNKRYLIVVSAGLLGILIFGIAALAIRGKASAPNPKTADPKHVANYLASNSFRKLSNEKKQDYLNQLRQRTDFSGPPRGLSEAQQEQIRRNIEPVMRAGMEKEIEDFAKLSPADQIAFLDQRIDQMEAMRKKGGTENAEGRPDGPPPGGTGGPPPGGPPPGGRGGGRPGAPNRDMMRQMIGRSNPRERALRTKFMDAMRKRMKERGMDGPP